jgi:hypothetical protein
MKLTTRLKRGRKSEWWVLQGGASKMTVAEINRELIGGVSMKYRPYIHMRDKRGPDGEDYYIRGEDYYLRGLPGCDTLDDAVEAVRSALVPAAVVEVTDRVSFIGVGMTADRAAKFANAMSRKIAEEGLR